MAGWNRSRVSTGALGLACALMVTDVAVATQAGLFRRVHEMVPPRALGTVVGDWDGDGDLDLATTGLGLVENVDRGRFEVHPATNYEESPVASADFDGDGRDDLLAVRYESAGVSAGLFVWLRRDAGLVRFTLLAPSSGARHFEAAVTGDLDGDGDFDVLAHGFDVGQPISDTVFFNDGDGGFGAAEPVPGGNSKLVRVRDLDGDGDLDLLRTDGIVLELLLNDGHGAFHAPPAQPPVPASFGSGPHLADFDGDGDADFLAGNPPRLYLNDGAAVFLDEGEVLPPVSFAFFVGDLDADGLPDVLGESYRLAGGERFGFFRNAGGGRFLPTRDGMRIGSSLVSTLQDFDGDGDLDLLGQVLGRSWNGGGLCFAAEEKNALWLNDGSGRFVEAADPWEVRGSRALVAAAGDLDGDPFPDVLALPVYDRVAYTYRNLGDGTFREESSPLAQTTYVGNLQLGDVDGDGDLDAIASGPLLLLNDGHGAFTDASSRMPGPGYGIPRLSELGDLDGDGDLDLLVEKQPGRNSKWQAYVWKNDGLGNFAGRPLRIPAVTYPTWHILLGDVDGDGDLDAALSDGRLWLNDGDAAFTVASLATGGDFAALADLDDDGDLDFLANSVWCIDGCQTTHAVSLNDGAGVFLRAPSVWPFDELDCVAGWMSAADVDGDGDLDVVDGHCGLWRNVPAPGEAGRKLEDASAELPVCGDGRERLAIADFDLDGDLDLWYPGVPRPVVNTTRHVSWRSFPRAGKPLTMEVFGPAGTPYRLFASDLPSDPLPTDLGLARLALDGLRLVAVGVLDDDGHAAVTHPVPADLFVPGSTVYWQALVGSPPRFTNLELTTFDEL